MTSAEHLGPPNLKIAGFQLWLHGCDRDLDYDWLRVTAHCGALGAEVWTSGSILMLDDIISLRNGCRQLLDSEINEIVVSPLEPELELSIRKADGVGHYDFVVKITPDYMSQKHEFEITIDQTYLRQAITQCEEIITKVGRK